MGELWGYKYTPMPTDFYIWTFVSGIKNVTIQYHEDKDGINPISDTNNEVYQSDLENVGPWISMAMVHRIFPKVIR